ncbi:hypothetical protein [Alkaliphilus sp. B6464]|uniref:hypothetical protein n=1 Tax=Alkaliphilus sp. B6464 TaxID=2731219 RepID=UPI001BAA8FC8|nr:hypothetical protein [Alkaliphilus sp. B6464]QUH22067.1 hypothetical protein HYG84_19365 [Alkaliphilus sp. B6464]
MYGNPHGKHSNIPDGASCFIYIDRPVLYGEILDMCSDLGTPRKDTLTIRIIPCKDAAYSDDRDNCENVSELLLSSEYRKIN